MIKNKALIVEDLKTIINDYFKIETYKIVESTKLFNGGLNLNSIQMVELTVAIETYFENTFNDELLVDTNFENISVLSDLVLKNLIK